MTDHTIVLDDLDLLRVRAALKEARRRAITRDDEGETNGHKTRYLTALIKRLPLPYEDEDTAP